MKKDKVTTFGEIMVRLSPSVQYQPLRYARQLELDFAGAEASVASNLSLWGTKSKFVTVLPDQTLGYAALNSLRTNGVDTSQIHFSEGRIGTYYIEYGASIRASKILYDRAGSAIAVAKLDVIDWKKVFEDTKYFFVSGITAALSANCQKNLFIALKMAKEQGITTCFDLNFRRSLMTQELAQRTFTSYMPFIDILIANEGAAFDIFDIKPETKINDRRKRAIDVIDQLKRKFSTLKKVAITIRNHISASNNEWSGALFSNNDYFLSKNLEIEIVDRIGSGDAFASGILHGIYNDWDDQRVLDYAVAASALKHTIPGDLCPVPEKEILEVANGHISAHIKR